MHDTTIPKTDHLATILLSRLHASVNGRVITPGDPGYDQARAVFDGGIDRRPAGHRPARRRQ